MPRRKKQAAAGAPKESAAQLIKTVRRQTRTKYSAEDKIRIVLEGLRAIIRWRRYAVGKA
ncbi:MAG: hypothetical protein IPK53_17465 [bacterium]|nr:hypothetical protein [bacterium]